jgi:hypothetical protein
MTSGTPHAVADFIRQLTFRNASANTSDKTWLTGLLVGHGAGLPQKLHPAEDLKTTSGPAESLRLHANPKR